MKDVLFFKPLDGRKTGEQILRVLDSFVTSHGLLWTKCVGICTDGAKAMTGKHSGVVSRASSSAPCNLGTLQHPQRGVAHQGNAWLFEGSFGRCCENCKLC